jgi:tRNA pseudouridine13 synthase
VKHSATTTRRRFVKIADEIKVSGGVPNFFGHQRFGTVRPITHLVGKAIVKGSLENAVMLFLAKSSPHEHPTSREARLELWQTRSLEKAMCDFPKQLRYERLMLKSLAERPCDFAAALRRLPPRLCELFVQGYQSYLFNRSLSERIKKGLSLSAAEVGDYAVSVERSGLPMLTMFKRVSRDNRAEVNKAVEKGKMRLAIPLIGHRQCPSEGVQGDIERRILEEEGVSPSDFRVACLTELSAKGKLRSVIAPVKDLSFECLRDRSAEKLRSRVNVDFMLYRGSYATVVLREFMKARNLIAAGF